MSGIIDLDPKYEENGVWRVLHAEDGKMRWHDCTGMTEYSFMEDGEWVVCTPKPDGV